MDRTARLWIVLVVNVLLVSALVIVGLAAHSLGVVAEGGDYLADAGAIAVSLLATWLGNRPPTPERPNGYRRATTLAAAVNAGWLLVLSLLVIVGASLRLIRGTGEVRGLPVLIVSGVAAVVMLGCALLLGNDDDDDDDEGLTSAAPSERGEDLNMRAVLLDTATDAAAAAGVAVSGAIILATGRLFWLDPAVALVIAVVVAYQAIRLLREIVAALRAPLPAAVS